MQNPFDWNYLASIPTADSVLGVFATVFMAVMAFLFIDGIYFYFVTRRRMKDNKFASGLISRLSTGSLVISIVGFFFLIMRFLGVDFLGWRLWLYVVTVALIAGIAYIIYYRIRIYPRRLLAYEASQRKRKYMPPSAPTIRPAGGGSARSGGKRKKKK